MSPSTPDPLAPVAFERANEAMIVLEASTGAFLEVNDAFTELTGYRREEALAEGFRLGSIVAPESQTGMAPRPGPPPERDRTEVRLVCKDGRKLPAELSARRVELPGPDGARRTVLVGLLRDLSAQKRSQRELWGRIEEMGLANTRVFALTEKLKRVPEVAPRLLNATDERELLTQAAELLCSREGLAYARVRFYLEREGSLRPIGADEGHAAPARKIDVDSPHRVARIFRGQQQPVTTAAEAVLPLMGRAAALGVMEVGFDPKEIDALRGNDRTLKAYYDLLGTMASTLGLLLENLRLSEALRRQALTDTLTGVQNRRHFSERLAEEIQRCARYGRSLSVLMIDVDHFKEINDSMGHGEGDRILVSLARLLRTMTREVDSVCRYGGDEFALLLPETALADAAGKGEALRKAVAEMEFPLSGAGAARRPRVSISVGAAAGRPGLTDEGLLKEADEALYEAKRLGRNRVCFFEPGSQTGARAV